ncbi:hypothetical protein [Limosilactobacillus reuteri]|uniref:hypothetical protein n=1 Tax=Limosilactobacillus reuteri TaxID=1598 RepID=UPI001E2CA7B1|nr:hypothetical protein [Limosilactobacillus reuteri]MCC4501903.1 hypothetical protein [Limosilactobacillus reuteri]
MDDKEVRRKFLLGGTVYYKGKMYAVIAVNKLNHTYTIQRLNDRADMVTDVKVEELS